MNTSPMHLDDASTFELGIMPQSESLKTTVKDERERTVLNEADMRTSDTIAPTFISQLEMIPNPNPQSESVNTTV